MAQVTLGTHISPEASQALDEYSKENGISKSQIVDKALKEYLEKQRDRA